MYIKTFRMEPLGVNSHLAWIPDGRAVVVDCGGEPEMVLREIVKRRLVLTAVLLTHLHFDHMLGARRLAEATGAPVLGPAANGEAYRREYLQKFDEMAQMLLASFTF